MHINPPITHLGGRLQHFSVIQSLCRIGLKSGDMSFRQQVERLRDRLAKAGDTADADTLQRLLSTSMQSAELVPTRVELSRFHAGEELTELVHPPVDRETAQPLCRIVLNPNALTMRPILSEHSQTAITNLIREWRTHDRLEALGVAPSRSCLIFGPPGSGKTLSAYYLAAELALPIVDARIDGLISSFLGTTARNIANLFAFANRYRCLLLLDEFDAIAKVRDDPQEVGEIKRVVNSLLQNLDDRADIGITVAVTNHHRLLDTAVWRRFENQIQLDPPDLHARNEMLALFLKPLPPSEILLRTMAYVTDGNSGADLKRIANATKRLIALSCSEPAPTVQFSAFREVLAREPSTRTNSRAARLAEDLGSFIALAMNDPEFDVKQKPLATLLAVNQATISRWLSRADSHTSDAAHA
jgi:MoxR-like ATPase